MSADNKSAHRMPERLKRLERVWVENQVYFVTFRAGQRKPLVTGPELHQSRKGFFQRALPRPIFVGRYILIPDHVSLFVKLPPPVAHLFAWVKSLTNSLSKTLNQLGHAAPHWQKGFFDYILRSPESYSARWLYMAENPVRAGLVAAGNDRSYQGEIHALEF